MEKVYQQLNNIILRRVSKTFLLRLLYFSIWVVVYMLVIPVGEVFCPHITPNSRAFFLTHNEPSDLPLQILGQITLEGKILPLWITSSWPERWNTIKKSLHNKGHRNHPTSFLSKKPITGWFLYATRNQPTQVLVYRRVIPNLSNCVDEMTDIQ